MRLRLTLIYFVIQKVGCLQMKTMKKPYLLRSWWISSLIYKKKMKLQEHIAYA